MDGISSETSSAILRLPNGKPLPVVQYDSNGKFVPWSWPPAGQPAIRPQPTRTPRTPAIKVPVKVRQMKWQDLHDEIEKLSAPKRDEGLQLWQEQKDANDKATCCRGKYLAKVRMWLVETWNNLDNNANVA